MEMEAICKEKIRKNTIKKRKEGIKYYECGKIGHIKRNYWQQPQRPKQCLQRTIQMAEEDFNWYLQWPDTPTIPPVCSYENVLDTDLGMDTPSETTEHQKFDSDSDLSMNERTPRIMFKMREHYIIYTWNEKTINVNISETAVKNIFIYKKFS